MHIYGMGTTQQLQQHNPHTMRSNALRTAWSMSCLSALLTAGGHLGSWPRTTPRTAQANGGLWPVLLRTAARDTAGPASCGREQGGWRTPRFTQMQKLPRCHRPSLPPRQRRPTYVNSGSLRPQISRRDAASVGDRGVEGRTVAGLGSGCARTPPRHSSEPPCRRLSNLRSEMRPASRLPRCQAFVCGPWPMCAVCEEEEQEAHNNGGVEEGGT